jgi:hypothetical protein
MSDQDQPSLRFARPETDAELRVRLYHATGMRFIEEREALDEVAAKHMLTRATVWSEVS